MILLLGSLMMRPPPHPQICTVLFTSPHLVKVNERIRLDGKPLPDAVWAKHFWAVWDRLHQVGSDDQRTAPFCRCTCTINHFTPPSMHPSDIRTGTGHASYCEGQR